MHESQSAKRSEEMLSNQMLSGIPEVDLGIEFVSFIIVMYIGYKSLSKINPKILNENEKVYGKLCAKLKKNTGLPKIPRTGQFKKINNN